MSGYVVKQADEGLRHRVHFKAPLLQKGETVTGDAGWLIQEARPAQVSLRVSEQSIGPSHGEALFEGGAPGDLFLITVQVDTSTGRLLRHSFVLSVARPEPQ